MRITIIGSGNVATHLGAALKNAGHTMVQVYSRNMDNAALLAYYLKAEATDDLKNINPDTSLFIIAVKDDAIEGIIQQLAPYNKLILHTSGSADLHVIVKYTQLAGVFYPLQTFSKHKEVDFRSVPVCTEGATLEIATQIAALAKTVSNNVYDINSAQRRVLHLAAVFASNFPNYLYNIAQSLLGQHQLNFNLLRPLITETADKVQYHFPTDVQTGPAVRNDATTMNKHLEMLSNEPAIKAVYELLSQGIIKMDKGSTHPK